MARLLALATVLVAAISCDRAAAVRTSVGALTDLADTGCACTTAVCAAKVRRDADAALAGAARIPPRDRPALEAARARLEACLAHAPP